MRMFRAVGEIRVAPLVGEVSRVSCRSMEVRGLGVPPSPEMPARLLPVGDVPRLPGAPRAWPRMVEGEGVPVAKDAVMSHCGCCCCCVGGGAEWARTGYWGCNRNTENRVQLNALKRIYCQIGWKI